ncbi:MAG: uroporphyrinogen decarboxylase family protein [Kiritimatiellae bacterium]|nr:uroporphyrinogen decarboxylase family protein [Kiritimatiellia bacterium]
MQSAHHRRVHAVFSGQWPDRIPICEQAFASSVAGAIMGRPMHTGSTELHYEETLAWTKGEAAHADFVEQIYQDSVALQRYFDFDIYFPPWRMDARPSRQIDEYTFLYGNPDEVWHIRQFDPVSRTFGVVKASHTWESGEEVCDHIRRALQAAAPAAAPATELSPFLERAQRELGNEFVVAGVSGLSIPMQAGWLEATVLEPELIGAWLDLGLESLLAGFEAQKQAGIMVVNGGGDFAFNSGPIYSPAFFKKIMAPRWKRIFDACRQLGLFYIMRSDGNLWPVAEALFEWAKPHAYYECDYDAGMRFDELRARFPELVLMGNVSCDFMLRATPQQIRDRTTTCIQAAAPRVVAATANSVMHGTPPENVLALYDAAKSYRTSP